MRNIATLIMLVACMLLAPSTGHAQAQQSPINQPAAQTKSDPVQEAKLQALQTEIQVTKDFTQHIL